MKSRITSYNVCYTKLLRSKSDTDPAEAEVAPPVGNGVLAGGDVVGRGLPVGLRPPAERLAQRIVV